MILVKNKYIPVKGYSAMAIYPFIFVRKECGLSDRLINHERIHFEQQKELLIVFFYIVYLILWIRYGYKDIPFEKEAYANEKNLNYLETRARFAWLKYF